MKCRQTGEFAEIYIFDSNWMFSITLNENISNQLGALLSHVFVFPVVISLPIFLPYTGYISVSIGIGISIGIGKGAYQYWYQI